MNARRNRRTPTRSSWESMKARCKPNAECAHHYYDRGITICERWQKYENFLADMGERPEGTTLDRWPDNDGNYEPGNCRWATRTEQNRNRRGLHIVEFAGETMLLTEAIHRAGIPVKAYENRVYRRGWSVEKALSTPVRPKRSFASNPVPRVAEHRRVKHHTSKLTEEQVREIRASAEKNPALAARFGVSITTVSEIRNYRKWKHVA